MTRKPPISTLATRRSSTITSKPLYSCAVGWPVAIAAAYPEAPSESPTSSATTRWSTSPGPRSIASAISPPNQGAMSRANSGAGPAGLGSRAAARAVSCWVNSGTCATVAAASSYCSVSGSRFTCT
jgi:hypothetical protein